MGPVSLGRTCEGGRVCMGRLLPCEDPCRLGGVLAQTEGWRSLDSSRKECLYAGLLAIRAERDQC